MTESELIVSYEKLVEELQELNIIAPEIKSKYSSFQKELEKQRNSLQKTISDAKAEINKAEDSGKKNITELSTARKKEINERFKKLDEVVQKAEGLQKALGEAADIVEIVVELDAKIKELEKQINSLKKTFKKQTTDYKDLEERVSSLEEAISQLQNEEEQEEIEIDYDEVLPAIEIYDKYEGKIGRPIVLERERWTNDYCFKITDIDEENERLIGDCYKEGVRVKEDQSYSYYTKFKMFDGETLDQVLDDE